MASVFGHIIAGGIFAKIFERKTTFKLILISALCSIIPDADVIGFYYGVDYGHPLGHRGFSHSILFAALLAMILTLTLFRYANRPWLIGICLFLSTISHSLLDALTNGGLGVGLFIPFDNTRYFFEYRPIQVSPIGIESFFSIRGWRVIRSELLWIGIPGLVIFAIVKLLKKK